MSFPCKDLQLKSMEMFKTNNSKHTYEISLHKYTSIIKMNYRLVFLTKTLTNAIEIGHYPHECFECP